MISDRVRRGIVPFQQVLGFAISQWARHPATLAAIVACVATWTLSDVLMPVFAGRLIDALSSPDRTTALRAAVAALGGMVGLGVTLVAARHLFRPGALHPHL